MTRRFGVLVGLSSEARIARRFARVVLVGGGTAAGAAAALSAARPDDADLWISFGLAGGLDPALVPGTPVYAREVVDPDGNLLTAPTSDLARGLSRGVTGRIVAGSALVASVADKQALRRATQGLAVDLETAALARWCVRYQRPYAVIRVVADPADRALPPAARLPLTSDGAPNLGAILGSLAWQPTQLPGLLRLARDSRAAHTAMARTADLLRG